MGFFRLADSARIGCRHVIRRLAGENLERRDVMSADLISLPPDTPLPDISASLPGSELRLSTTPTVSYGPVYPVRVDTTERLVAPQPAPTPTPIPSPEPQLIDRLFSLLAEGEEPGGGMGQQQQTPVIDEFFYHDEPAHSRWFLLGHVNYYQNPEQFTVYFDLLLEGHSVQPNGAGDFVYEYRYTPGEFGYVGAVARRGDGLESNRVEIFVFSA